MEEALHVLQNAVLPRLEKALSLLQEKVPDSLGQLSFGDLVGSIRSDIHQLCEGRSPTSLDELLENLAKVSQSSGIETSYHRMGSEVHLDWATTHECARICQEACQNAIKHSGATELRLLAVVSSSDVILTVVDNGVGCAESTQGYASMKKRAQAIKADLSIERHENGGMVLILTVSNLAKPQPDNSSVDAEGLGKEIHDGICQEMAALIMMSSYLRDETNEEDPALWRNYREAAHLFTEACDLARALSHRLMGR